MVDSKGSVSLVSHLVLKSCWHRQVRVPWPASVKSLGLIFTVASVFAASPARSEEDTIYTYDALGRLVEAERCGIAGSAAATQFSFDAVGNRANMLKTTPGTATSGYCNSPNGTDFNSDGFDDVLWRNDAGAVTNWLGSATGGFTSNDANAWVNVGLEWQIVGTGDFNGDGRDDLVWRRLTDGRLTTWHGTANGSWTDNHPVAYYTVDLAWEVAGTGDFNGDGRTDLLFRHTNGTLVEWLGEAGPTFADNSAVASYVVPLAWKVADTGDFNGDNRSDILWRNDNGELGVWLGQPNGSLVTEPTSSTTVDISWTITRAGDFNGDGKDDILWRHNLGQLSVWLAGTSTFWIDNYSVSNVFVPTAWQVVDGGDYNGDGRDDILWRNTNGDVSNWLGNPNGSFTPNDANAYNVVPNSWHVQGF